MRVGACVQCLSVSGEYLVIGRQSSKPLAIIFCFFRFRVDIVVRQANEHQRQREACEGGRRDDKNGCTLH